jgi:hypothetical protein
MERTSLFIIMIAAGCGGSSSSGAFSLSVSNAAWDWKGGGPPDSGNRWFQATATLTNQGESAPLSESSDFFSVRTDKGLQIASLSFGMSELSGACTPADAVAAGGTDSCNLVFELPLGAQPTTLDYRDAAGRASSATIDGLPAPSTPACLAKLAAAPLVGSNSGSAAFSCAACAAEAGCQHPASSCNVPSSCGGVTFCSAQCPPTPACDQQASDYIDCAVQKCPQYCTGS